MTPIRKAINHEELESIRGTWWYAISQDKRFAICHCPGCDALWSLDRWHIATDGSVTPSVNHPIELEGCGFHDVIKLEGWQP